MKTKLKRLYFISAILFLALLISSLLLKLFEKPFNGEDWRNHPKDRHEMVDNLIQSQLLIGNTKDEVIKKLGEPLQLVNSDKKGFIYSIGEVPSFFNFKNDRLLIFFENDKVVKVSLATE